MLEICIDSLESARNALKGGADRLEVCSSLSEGGLTPTPGFVKALKKISSEVPLFVMIRIRGGNFVYTREEMDAMLYDVETMKGLGVDGFVFGALTEDNRVHEGYCRQVISMAEPLPTTFHRAFDQTADPMNAIRVIKNLGFKRILTSGQKSSVEYGLDLIKKLMKEAKNEIIVMPGAGITKDNLLKIKTETDAKEFHASAKKKKTHVLAKPLRGNVRIGANEDDTFVMVTDEELVKELAYIVKNCR